MERRLIKGGQGRTSKDVESYAYHFLYAMIGLLAIGCLMLMLKTVLRLIRQMGG